MTNASNAALMGFIGGLIFFGYAAYIYTKAAYQQAIHRFRLFVIDNMKSFGCKDNDMDTGYWIMLASMSEFLLSDLVEKEPKILDIITWNIPEFNASVLPSIVEKTEDNYLSCFNTFYGEEIKKGSNEQYKYPS